MTTCARPVQDQGNKNHSVDGDEHKGPSLAGELLSLMMVWRERTSLCFVLFVLLPSRNQPLRGYPHLISWPCSSACLAALSKLSELMKKRNTWNWGWGIIMGVKGEVGRWQMRVEVYQIYMHVWDLSHPQTERVPGLKITILFSTIVR